jgi:VIT1/CCC1 family predicted Fe2+/Mn2+ transporter
VSSSRSARGHDLRAHRRREAHVGQRAGWLRAAVLGANDGVVSTASLMVGVAAAESSRTSVLVAGIAGLTAGALSMAAGEYVSVSSQRDLEEAELELEAVELAFMPDAELDELTAMYERRGLDRDLARQVAEALTAHDALETHAREELGIDPGSLAQPVQASAVSALSFTVGSLLPILVVAVASRSLRVPLTIVAALVGLVLLGVTGARLGGASVPRAAARVLVGGALALGISLGVGHLVGAAI